MTIYNTVQEAFNDLDHYGADHYFPAKAIEFLQNHPTTQTIEDRIARAIREVHNPEYFYISELDKWLIAPLYYAIVAEEHLTEKVVKAVIHFVTFGHDNEFEPFEEQIYFLAGKLGYTFPGSIPPSFLNVIERQVKRKSNSNYEVLYDALLYIDPHTYKDQLLSLLELHERFNGTLCIYVELLACIGLTSALPKVEYLVELYGSDFLMDHEETMAIFNKTMDPEVINGSIFESRAHWKAHYPERLKNY